MSDKIILTKRHSELLRQFEWNKRISSGLLSNAMRESVSSATLRRDLSVLVKQGYLIRSGGNRDSEYALTDYGLLHRDFDLGAYHTVPETHRRAILEFNQDIFKIIKNEPLFSTSELSVLDDATSRFKKNAFNASDVIYKKELERFVIDFSWKSSQIEGNTYTLLETERLIKEGLKKSDKSDFETSMILNHKKAYEFLLMQTKDSTFELTRAMLEHIHSLVVDQLNVTTGLRRAAVGISGSLYRPLSLIFQIREQLDNLIDCINSKSFVYEKALVAILGESYLQPFEDGNKRTARVLANGILLQAGYAPLSYRSVDEQDYKEACLIFYEQNSFEPFKKIFIEQYIFAADNYNMAKDSQ